MLDSLHKPIFVTTFLIIASICAGCSGHNPTHQIAVATGFAINEAQPAGFVSQSRAKQLKYKPIGLELSGRDDAPMNNADLDKLKRSLEARRIKNNVEAEKIRAVRSSLDLAESEK